MSTSAISSSSSAASGVKAAEDNAKAFRQADFLKIMLAEVTSQSPFDPQETSKLVENMQKLQELANSTYEKFRADIQWGQNLMGKQVAVQQMPLTPQEKEKLVNKGVQPDVGYSQKSGTVESFRVVDQVVYVTVGGKDYPVDNIKQIVPQQNTTDLADMADRMLGKSVAYFDSDSAATVGGKVTAVTHDQDGNILLEVGGKAVPYRDITQIGL